MRVAVVDIGSNSTRLLIADVDGAGDVTELTRRSQVTRLGAGVDARGRLSEDAMGRVYTVLDSYAGEIEAQACQANLAVLTSAVRDAVNGVAFTERVREEYHLDARTLAGEQEAQLTFLGAMSERDALALGPTAVIDIGGGSTEFIIGIGATAGFHISTQVGVVRMSERHVHSDPPAPGDLQALSADTRDAFARALPAGERSRVATAIAVAGTATSAAAINQALEPYDPQRVHGYRLSLDTVEMLRARLADMDENRRRRVPGLHPDRAQTIVAGMIVLSEAMRAFDLDEVEVSEHDILRGGVLRLAGLG